MSEQHPTQVVTFQKEYLPAFVALNRAWIEHHFVLEPADLRQLEDPYATILDPGGEILFVLGEGRAVGTVALVPHGPGSYEIAKMAVDVAARGKGYGDVLMQSAIKWAKSRGAKQLTLLSNTVLSPAITLYKKHGFQTVHLGPHPDYERCNIEMALQLP